jgi:hypothetical protein
MVYAMLFCAVFMRSAVHWCLLSFLPPYIFSDQRCLLEVCPTIPIAPAHFFGVIIFTHHALDAVKLDAVKVHSWADIWPDTAASWVQAATFEECLLDDGDAGEESTCTQWRGLVPNHLQVAEWACKKKRVLGGRRGIHATFKLQAKSGML